MARYVDADKLLERFREAQTNFAEKLITINLLEAASTADVAPIIHAKWIRGRYCSNCECDDYDYCGRQPKYCPNCGAEMENPRLMMRSVYFYQRLPEKNGFVERWMQKMEQ